MRLPPFATWFLGLVLISIFSLAGAHPGHDDPPARPAAAEVTEQERQADAALLKAIRSGEAAEKEIEAYTDRLFERDGERPSEATRDRLQAILEAALSVEKYRRSKIVHHQWGALLFEGGYYDSAIGAFGRALRIDPGFLPSLLGTGTAYLAKGMARHAARSLLRAVLPAGQDPLVWFHLTQTLLRLRPPDPSEESAERKEALTAFALLRFESHYKNPLPETLSKWKEANPEAVEAARGLTIGEFLEGARALAPPIEEAIAKARKDGITFRDAQRFEELRQEYLEAIERRIRPRMGRYFAGLLYDPDRFQVVRSLRASISRLPWRDDRERVRRIVRSAKEGGAGAIVITLEEELGTGRPSPIYVLDQMFGTPSIPSEEDLVSALVNHERVHLDQVGEGIRLRSGRRIDARNFAAYHEVDLKIPGRPPVKTIQVAQEVQAYAEELRQALSGKFEVTPLYLRSAAENFRLFYGLLERIGASGVGPDDQFARELAEEVKDVAETLQARFPVPRAEMPSKPLSLGERVYAANCAACHGVNGDGRGMAAHMLGTKPRDFTKGLFKFRSTPPGAPPSDEDLLRILSEGIRGTGMVPQENLPEADRRAVVDYIKRFSKRFQDESAEPPVRIPEPPREGDDFLRLGGKIFEEAECWKCHGKDAKGRGPSAEGLVDAWGAPIAPPDLTRRPLKASNTAEALYRIILTGVEGTPMPSYQDALTGREIWALVRYLESLVPKPEWENMHATMPEERRGFVILRHHGGGIR